MPIIGFGCSPLGGIYQVHTGFVGEHLLAVGYDLKLLDEGSSYRLQEPLDESEAIAAVHEAFKLGINYFDTSPYYGDTRSEQVWGRGHTLPVVAAQQASNHYMLDAIKEQPSACLGAGPGTEGPPAGQTYCRHQGRQIRSKHFRLQRRTCHQERP